jgi:hypothetical protein
MSTKSQPDIPKIKRGTYVHSKTKNRYEVIGVALQSETSEPLVIYRPLYQTKYELFARPYEIFTGTTEISGHSQPRFYMEDSENAYE